MERRSTGTKRGMRGKGQIRGKRRRKEDKGGDKQWKGGQRKREERVRDERKGVKKG